MNRNRLKSVTGALALLLTPAFSWAQFTLSGTVTDQISGRPVPGATISLEGTDISLPSDEEGTYTISSLERDTYTMVVRFLGYETAREPVTVTENTTLNIALTPASLLTEEVVVTATRAAENSATAFQNVDEEYLNKQNLGQDIPQLVDLTPSVTVSSDAGNGVGYTDIRIRGTDKTRINFTINGIPYNDPESHGVFLVNMPDFVSSIDNIQIQRGVGTSTNGAGAFGASVNIQTNKIIREPYAKLDNSYGSFNTLKNTVSLGSGLVGDNFSFNGRLSRIVSDGFVDRASSDLHSFFLNGNFQDHNKLLSINVFSGREKTYQAWNGIPEPRLRGDHQGMLRYIERNFLDEEAAEHLLESGSRTYNEFTYEDQTDNYQQDHYQLFYSQQFSPSLNGNIGLHYTRGAGYYEEYRKEEDFETYGLEPLMLGEDTISSTDLVRRRWLSNDFYGLTWSLNYTPSEEAEFTLGGAYNEYNGNHFGEITWAQYASGSFKDDRFYDNDAFKNDFNVFGRGSYRFTDRIMGFLDLQYRRIYYSFFGFDRNQRNVQQQVTLDFFNPKAGITYFINPRHNVYASFGVAGKEPNRDDFTESSPDSRPRPERLYDLEAGWRHQSGWGRVGVNYYWMNYKDQLILTGQINDVGAYTRTNVEKSYRMGIEFYGLVNLTEHLTWNANVTLSRNKIQDFTEYVDDYDQGIQASQHYSSTDIALSPGIIAGSELSYQVFPPLSLTLMSKYSGKQYLDNTASEARRLDAYFIHHFRINYDLPIKGLKEAAVTVLVNNLFNTAYETSGYTWGYIAGGERISENFYFPQAGINFLAGLSVKF